MVMSKSKKIKHGLSREINNMYPDRRKITILLINFNGLSKMIYI